MKIVLAGVVILLLALALALFVLSRKFQAQVQLHENIIRTSPPPVVRAEGELPELMRRLAERGLAAQDGMPRAVRMTQDIGMLRDGNWSSLTAYQYSAVAEPGFIWVADGAGWPIPIMRVVDRFTRDEGALEVRLLGAIQVALFDGPDADVGEAMRYMLEMPLVPDAILANQSIVWRELGEDVIEAELPLSPRPAIVQFRFDETGDLVELTAEGRPAVSDSGTELRDWRGLFSDYEEIGGRRVPRIAEVGYVDDGVYSPYFRGRITSYELLR